MVYKYTNINDKIGKIELDGYNRNDSILSIAEAKIIKENDEILAVYAALSGVPTNIVKSVKSSDGKWGADPTFKLESPLGLPLVKLEIPFKVIEKESKAGKKYTIGSVSESFVAEKLLSDFGDGGLFEGTINLGIDKSMIEQLKELEKFKSVERGLIKYQTTLELFYECSKLETLTILTDGIIESCMAGGSSSYKGKTQYQKPETTAEKLAARSEYVKRFLCDNWNTDMNFSEVTFDESLAYWNGRLPKLGKENQTLLLELMNTITSIQ
jgi:hypothetical protein